MVQNGARHVVLASRSASASSSVNATVAECRTKGASVEAVACDVTDHAQLQLLISDREANRPPIGGVIHAAMVLNVRVIPLSRCSELTSVTGCSFRQHDA